VRSDTLSHNGPSSSRSTRGRCIVALVALCAALGAAALSGCKSAPSATPVSGSVQGASELNRSVNQRASPLLLRVYELKSETAFNKADFMALYQSDQATLGADLVAREEFMLAPGEIRPYKKTLAPETRFVGVVAAYRDLERSTWRTIAPIPKAGKAQKLLIRADSLAVSVSMQP
jgi:type VI secretion system protein VasD